MSYYTTEVRYLCESMTNVPLENFDNLKGVRRIDAIIDSSKGNIFDFEYPIFDEAYRGVLEKKILRHYYTREIGQETFGLFQLFLSDKMNEIMPYYNQLYQSELLKIEPLVSVSRKVSHEGKGSENKTTKRNGTNSSNSNTNGNTNTWSYYSDTPQGGIVGLENNDYLTNATHNTGTDSTSSTLGGTTSDSETGTGNRSDSYVDQIVGYEGNQSEMLLKFRETFLNIDMMIIDEVKDLFFMIY